MASNGKWVNPNPRVDDHQTNLMAQSLTSHLGGYQDWTPVLTADLGNPTLGTNSATAGECLRQGVNVKGTGYILFGSAAVAAGTGTYRVSLPFAPVPAVASRPTTVIGGGFLFDSSVTTLIHFLITLDANGLTALTYESDAGGLVWGNAGATFPWTWNTNDQISFWYDYRCLSNATFKG